MLAYAGGAGAAILSIALVFALASRDPSAPAPRYAVDIAFCRSTQPLSARCPSQPSSTGDRVFLHVFVARAKDRAVTVAYEVTAGGTARGTEPPIAIYTDRIAVYHRGFERGALCAAANCTLRVRALVAGKQAASAEFAFVGR
jgi:hypothetical protein